MPEWGWPVIVTAFIGLIGLLYHHAERRLQSLEAWRLKELESAIPTRMSAAERDLEGLHEWKHEKIDPYVPPEVINLKRDVDSLKKRVFEERQ